MSIPAFVLGASDVYGATPEVFRRCKIDADPDSESVRVIDGALKLAVARADSGAPAADVRDVCSRSRKLGYRRQIRDGSLRDRLVLLNWLSANNRQWQRHTQLRYLRDCNMLCPDLIFSDMEGRCLSADSLATPSAKPDLFEVNGDVVEMMYGRIKSKLKYINSLEVSRVKLVHRLGRKIADVFPALADCKHVKSLFVGGAINCAPADDLSQQGKLKELCASAQTAKDHEALFLDWSQPDTASSKQKAQKYSDAGSGIVYDDSNGPEREDDQSWSILQQELSDTGHLAMLAELEEAISYHMNISGGFDLRASQKVAASVDQKVGSLVQLLLDESTLEDYYSGSEKDPSILLQNRLSRVHERYQNEVNFLLNNSVQHRFIQQHLPTRYAGTGAALHEMRLKHKNVMTGAAAACEEASPFQFKFIAPGKITERGNAKRASAPDGNHQEEGADNKISRSRNKGDGPSSMS